MRCFNAVLLLIKRTTVCGFFKEIELQNCREFFIFPSNSDKTLTSLFLEFSKMEIRLDNSQATSYSQKVTDHQVGLLPTRVLLFFRDAANLLIRLKITFSRSSMFHPPTDFSRRRAVPFAVQA